MPNIHHTLLIGTGSDVVFRALTTEKGLSGWWTPDTRMKAELNAVGFFPFGDNYHKEMEIVSLEPNKLLQWNCIQGSDEWIGTTISFLLQEEDKRTLLKDHPEIQGQMEQQVNARCTLLIFQHNNWRDYTPTFGECSYTWGQFLKSLKLFCETGQGRPWPFQHRA